MNHMILWCRGEWLTLSSTKTLHLVSTVYSSTYETADDPCHPNRVYYYSTRTSHDGNVALNHLKNHHEKKSVLPSLKLRDFVGLMKAVGWNLCFLLSCHIQISDHWMYSNSIQEECETMKDRRKKDWQLGKTCVCLFFCSTGRLEKPWSVDQ